MNKKNFLITIYFFAIFGAYSQDADTYYKDGVEKIKVGQYEEAIPFFSSCIELQPQNHFAWYNRGICKNKIGQYEKSLPDFEQVVKLAPNYLKGYLNRGSTKRHLKDYAGAISDYSLILKLDSSYADAYYNRANVYQILEKKDSACIDFKMALEFGAKGAQEQVDICTGKTEIHNIVKLTKKSENEKYGFTSENPIKIGKGDKGGPANERNYLDLIVDVKGNSIKYERIGSCCPYESKNGLFGLAMVDHYEITYLNDKGKNKKASVYLSFYDYEEPLILYGFKVIGQ
jgi:tetratricopeptide (TPR) repeat protein